MSRGFENREGLVVQYQDWSGCLVKSARQGAFPLLAFDPAPGHELPLGPMVILITHGHPEHVEGAAAHLSLSGRAEVSVIASPSVCRHLKRSSLNPRDNFFPVTAGERVDALGLRVETFGWIHAPLLPEGWAQKARYLMKLSGRPFHLASIARRGLSGPEHGPMIGYRLNVYKHGLLVYFGEGLHRKTLPAVLRDGLRGNRVDVLLSAVEPEDLDCLPGLVSGYSIRDFLAFEAHRVWRDEFGLPQADLSAFVEKARAKGGLQVRPLRSGDAVEIMIGEGAYAG